MPTPTHPTPRPAPDETEDRLLPKISAAKGAGPREDDFGDFNEEDFDDDFDDDFEEEMDDEYDLAEIEGEVEVEEIDDEDLIDLPLVEKIVKGDDDDEDGFDDAEPTADPEEDEEFEEEAE